MTGHKIEFTQDVGVCFGSYYNTETELSYGFKIDSRDRLLADTLGYGRININDLEIRMDDGSILAKISKINFNILFGNYSA